MCALLVGLPDVTVVGVGDWPHWLRIVIAIELAPASCCDVVAHGHGVREVELVDLPVFGRPARLVWRKQRWRCPACRRAWTEQDPQIASAHVRTDRSSTLDMAASSRGSRLEGLVAMSAADTASAACTTVGRVSSAMSALRDEAWGAFVLMAER
jgi:transposase